MLLWQAIATVAFASAAGVWAGQAGAISAALGGAINLAAGVAYALLLGWGLGTQPVPGVGTSLAAMFRAEAGKILVIIGGLWLALTMYREVIAAAFFAAFAVTVIIFSMAFFVRDDKKDGN